MLWLCEWVDRTTPGVCPAIDTPCIPTAACQGMEVYYKLFVLALGFGRAIDKINLMITHRDAHKHTGKI